MTPFPLGRHPQAPENHDPRSRNFAAPAGLPVVSRTWRRYGAVLDQGQLGSCTGNAVVHARNSAPNHVAYTTVYHEDAAVQIYSMATEIDPWAGSYPPEDTGSDGLSASKAAQALGLIGTYTHAFGIDHLVQALMSGPLIIGTDWYTGMFNPGPDYLVSISGSVAGGHEYACTGYDATHQVFRFQNSWGSGWGQYGKFYMAWDTLAALLGADGDAIQF